jgi:mRNA-degrading endonuclease RelE of RelBE toxin-antitoxin system
MYQLDFTPEAKEDLRPLRKYDRQRIIGAIEAQLAHQPATETHNRKHLRANPLADWELRVGPFRVFYDVDEQNARVSVVAIGQKVGSTLFVHGEEYQL